MGESTESSLSVTNSSTNYKNPEPSNKKKDSILKSPNTTKEKPSVMPLVPNTPTTEKLETNKEKLFLMPSDSLSLKSEFSKNTSPIELLTLRDQFYSDQK